MSQHRPAAVLLAKEAAAVLMSNDDRLGTFALIGLGHKYLPNSNEQQESRKPRGGDRRFFGSTHESGP